jgi:hypothetical protein
MTGIDVAAAAEQDLFHRFRWTINAHKEQARPGSFNHVESLMPGPAGPGASSRADARDYRAKVNGTHLENMDVVVGKPVEVRQVNVRVKLTSGRNR